MIKLISAKNKLNSIIPTKMSEVKTASASKLSVVPNFDYLIATRAIEALLPARPQKTRTKISMIFWFKSTSNFFIVRCILARVHM